MRSNLVFIRNQVIFFFACAIFICAMSGLIFIDVHWMKDAVHETSCTEIAQELMLLGITLSYFIHAYRQASLRYVLVLVGGFFACMLIRELDFLFDRIYHGSWLWFALATTALCIAVAAVRPQQAVTGLAAFLHHPGWGMMSAGLLTVLVFSRIFGMHELWQNLMQEGYSRTVKNMVEEGCELLGYSLCLFATCRYLCGEGKLTAGAAEQK